MVKIAVSTGEVDKRTVNGNNGTKRGNDKTERKRPTGYYVLKDEVKAGLAARLEMVIEFYGSQTKVAKMIGVSFGTVNEWRKRGMISARGAQSLHNAYKRNGSKGFRASFCRPDLRFDGNGKPITLRCDRFEMLRVVREDELANKPEKRSWKKLKEEARLAKK
ncbi:MULTISPECIES: hypothetical protein [Gammaproteobacteria]|uniref:hypothetical protein n=1 Tax=Gammaproteobacteria TaxID=1236 RepID=UPI002FCC5CB1